MTPAPLVILSAPHSEAATVAAALGNHPGAIALPELHLLHSSRVADLLQLYARATNRLADGLLRCIAELYCDGQSDAGITQAENFLKRRAEWSTTALLQQIVADWAPRRVVLHDTSAALRITDLDRYFEALPWAAFLHLQRHPLHFVHAARTHVDARLNIPPDYQDHGSPHPRLEPQLMWLRVHETLSRELAARGEQSMRTGALRLEDLYADPEAALRDLCAWLGWRCDATVVAAMLAPPRGLFCARGPQAAPGGFERPPDPQTPFVAPLAERHRTIPGAEASLATETGQLAEQLGYR